MKIAKSWSIFLIYKRLAAKGFNPYTSPFYNFWKNTVSTCVVSYSVRVRKSIQKIGVEINSCRELE